VYSTDGINWIGSNNGALLASIVGYSTYSLLGVTYSANLSTWVAVGSGVFTYSNDGMNWTPSANGTSIMTQPSGVCYSANIGLWVAVGYGLNSVAYSNDGITWTGSSTASALSLTLNGVACNPNPPVGTVRFVAVGTSGNGVNNFAYSMDGMVWSNSNSNVVGTSAFGGSYANGWGIAFGYSAPNVPLWVAVGQGINPMMSSTDGINWYAISTSISFTNQGGGYYYSVSDVAYSMTQSRWVAVGVLSSGGNIAYSNNGTNWTLVPFSLNTSSNANCVTYSETYSMWIAGGQQGIIAYSPNGINWSTSPTPFPFSAYVRSVAAAMPPQSILRQSIGSTITLAMNITPINASNYAQFTYQTSINSVPTYLNIPYLNVSGGFASGGNTSIGYQLVVTTGTTTFVTTTFTTNQTWTNGINIPLSIDAIDSVPNGINAPIFTVTMGTQTPTPTPQDLPHLISGSTITCTFSITTSLPGSSLQVLTYSSLNNGMQGTLYGYTYLVYPTMTPSSLAVQSPITLVANKNVAFVNLTSTSSSAISYTTSNSSIASIGYSNSASAYVINPITTGSITLTSNMSSNSVYLANQLVSNAIYIMDYSIPSGSIVPFFNKCSNIGDGGVGSAYIVGSPSNTPTMYVTFTQNVTLTALNFANAITKGFAGTCGGYSNGTNSTTYTLTFNNLISPTVQFVIGSITFTTLTNGGAYTAIANDANNQNGSNDGTLLLIPFSSTGFVSPTYVSNFKVTGLNAADLTFNVGDTLSIQMTPGTGSTYVITPAINFGVAGTPLGNGPMGEIVGALVATVNNPAPIIHIIALASSSTTLTGAVTTLLSTQLTINGKNIVTGFIYSGINIGYVSAPVTTSLVFTISCNGTAVFQVWFDYTETSSSLKNLYIPFSYAGFANQPNPNIANLCFNQPQNPIYNNGDTFQISLAFYTRSPSAAAVTSTVSYNCISGATLNNGAAGGVMGISLIVPTYTTIPTPATPVPYTMTIPATTTNILIPYPTSNSTGAYVQGIANYTPTNPSTVGTITAGSTGFNWALSTGSGTTNSSPVTTVTITGYQDSTPSFATGTIVYPSFDVVNSMGWAMASNPQTANNIMSIYNQPAAFITSSCANTQLIGFSFQYYGGLTTQAGSGTVITVYVASFNGTAKSTTTITLNASLGGTIPYVPFASIGSGYSYSIVPTILSSFTVTGTQNPSVNFGDLISISIVGGGSIAVNGVNGNTIAGSLIISNPFSVLPSYNWSVFTRPISTTVSPGQVTTQLTYNSYYPYGVPLIEPGSYLSVLTNPSNNIAYQSTGTITNGLILTGIMMYITAASPNTSLSFTVSWSYPPSIFNNPRVTGFITTTVIFTASSNASFPMYISVPFDVPLPGGTYSQSYNTNYYIAGVTCSPPVSNPGWSNTQYIYTNGSSNFIPIPPTATLNITMNINSGSVTYSQGGDSNGNAISVITNNSISYLASSSIYGVGF